MKRGSHDAENNIRSHFAFSIYLAAVAGSSTNNVVISPMGLRTCLSLAYFGADGTTEGEIRKCLYLPNSKQHVAEKLRNFNDSSKSQKAFVMANKISIPKNVEMKDEFVEKIKIATDEPPLIQDNSSSSISELNNIMSVLTNGKFKDVIGTENLENAKIILLSAIYLKATFKKPFDLGHTELDKFWVNGSNAIEVQMMHTIDKFRFLELPSLKARVVALPFHLENNLLLFLPDSKTGLRDIEQNLKDVEVFGISQAMTEKIISIKLPKFQVDFRMNCMSGLPKIGFKEIFSNSANFKSINENSKINISHIFHLAQVKINEVGAETSVPPDSSPDSKNIHHGEQIKFVVDRPFLFVIKDHRTVQFIGRVIKP